MLGRLSDLTRSFFPLMVKRRRPAFSRLPPVGPTCSRRVLLRATRASVALGEGSILGQERKRQPTPSVPSLVGRRVLTANERRRGSLMTLSIVAWSGTM